MCCMDIPFSRWYPVITGRRSRRHFDASRPIETDTLSALDTVCQQFNPFRSARSCLVTEPANNVTRSIIGSYGKMDGAPAYIAFIGNMDSISVQEEVGYTGEGIILEASALGLNTCWVGGFFRPEKVASLIEIKSNERVLAVTPVGYAHSGESLGEKLMTGLGRTHRRLPVSRLASRVEWDELSQWGKTAIQAARLAPSAVNRQPWEFDIEDGGIVVRIRNHGPEITVSKRLDCGIAMLHIEVAALDCGVRGQWQLLKSPRVARFSVMDSSVTPLIS